MDGMFSSIPSISFHVCMLFGNSEVLLVSMFGETREIDQELAAKSLCETAIALYASMTFAVH
jgi:hypothetical protein